MKCAIDFTSSNGEISHPDSLHYINHANPTMNQYEQAILQVGSILDVYSETKKYGLAGFGGKPRFLNSNDISHCFPLDLD